MGKKNEKVVVDMNLEEENNEKEIQDLENEVQEEILDEKDEKIKSLEETIENLTKEIDSVKKAAADIVNRNKKMEVDKKYASSYLIKNLLVPMSYFEGALKFQTEDENFKNFLKGFDMIYNLLIDQLYNDGLKQIETNIGDDFNPHIHEVHDIIEIEEGESDKILGIIEKGFYYKDRVIRPAQVKVSKLKEIENENNNETEENDSVIN